MMRKTVNRRRESGSHTISSEAKTGTSANNDGDASDPLKKENLSQEQVHELDQISLDLDNNDIDDVGDFAQQMGIPTIDSSAAAEAVDPPQAKKAKPKKKKKKVPPPKKPIVKKTKAYDPKTQKKMESVLKLARKDAKEELEQEKAEVLSKVPAAIQSMFGMIGFAKWSGRWLPALILSPYQVPPGAARDHWMKMFKKMQENARPLEKMSYLIYWYGEENASDYYSVVANSSFVPYADATKKMLEYAKNAEKKRDQGKSLSADDKQRLRGMDQLKEDLEKDPADRQRGDVDFMERDELLSLNDIDELSAGMIEEIKDENEGESEKEEDNDSPPPQDDELSPLEDSDSDRGEPDADFEGSDEERRKKAKASKQRRQSAAKVESKQSGDKERPKRRSSTKSPKGGPVDEEKPSPKKRKRASAASTSDAAGMEEETAPEATTSAKKKKQSKKKPNERASAEEELEPTDTVPRKGKKKGMKRGRSSVEEEPKGDQGDQSDGDTDVKKLPAKKRKKASNAPTADDDAVDSAPKGKGSKQRRSTLGDDGEDADDPVPKKKGAMKKKLQADGDEKEDDPPVPRKKGAKKGRQRREADDEPSVPKKKAAKAEEEEGEKSEDLDEDENVGDEGSTAPVPKKKKKKNRKESRAGEEEDVDGDGSVASPTKKGSKKKTRGADDDDESDHVPKKKKLNKKKRKRQVVEEDDEEEEPEEVQSEEEQVSKKKVSRKKKRRSVEEEEEEEAEGESDDSSPRKTRAKLRRRSSRGADVSPSPKKKAPKKKRHEDEASEDGEDEARRVFSENEDLLAPMLKRWGDAIAQKNVDKIDKCLSEILSEVPKLCAGFIEAYNLPTYMKETKTVLKQEDGGLEALGELRKSFKKRYDEAKKALPKLEHRIRFPELTSPPVKKESENGDQQNTQDSVRFQSQDSFLLATTTDEPADTGGTTFAIVSEGHSVSQEESGKSPGKQEDQEAAAKQDSSDWTKCPASVDTEDPQRLLGVEFLRQLGSHFPPEKVDVDGIAIAIEKALFERIGSNVGDKYWDRLHTIVAGICGDLEPGLLMRQIIDGEFQSAADLVKRTDDEFYASFRGDMGEENQENPET